MTFLLHYAHTRQKMLITAFKSSTSKINVSGVLEVQEPLVDGHVSIPHCIHKMKGHSRLEGIGSRLEEEWPRVDVCSDIYDCMQSRLRNSMVVIVTTMA
ncbi:hypothetical protein VNO77_26943 [Canavalia gladiata]|uniref:Uncharacterized protein n=1 Tax=Canavalia gladiata TaxID=3824 RepID=A0AAN9KWW7_CANGL